MAAEWAPSVEDVAALMRALTKPTDGQDPLGTFNEDTRPTGNQVEELISHATDEVAAAFASGEVPESSWDPAKQAAILKVAFLIEVSYFPERADEGGPSNTATMLRLQANAAMATLIAGANVRSLFSEAASE